VEENVQASTRDMPDISALTSAMSKGDEMAYRTFHKNYFDRLLRYLLVVARGDEDAAREALQLAFVRVVKHIKVFDAEEKFWSWLTVLARSAFADEAKKRRRYFSFLERFASHSEVEFQNNGEADEKLRALLQGKLWSLSDDERQLVERKYFEHRGVREMAEELQTTEKAVESKLSRLRKKLKDAVLSDLKNEPPL